MDIRLNARAVARFLGWVIAAITAAHLLGQVLRWQFGSGYGLVRFFHTNQEGIFPAYFSALNMLFAAVLLALCAATERRSRMLRASWLFLSVLFVYLPFDELFAVHERLNVPMRRVLDASGALDSYRDHRYAYGRRAAARDLVRVAADGRPNCAREAALLP